MLRNWDEIKRTEEGREPGMFGDVPENLPGPLYARKLLRRADVAPGIELRARGRHASVRRDARRARPAGDGRPTVTTASRRSAI